ncbi:hypothetical protein T492DRAFT_167250 [Pavlovales sp. CCMP2436]|nr:hypothetical protein T492DRAFT_167250 [Pavlovales sp. CCMP2436]
MSALSRTHYAGRTQNAGRGLVRTLWNAPRAKRFYKEVTIKEVAAAGGGVGYGVHLDGRLLRTPAKNELSLKSRCLLYLSLCLLPCVLPTACCPLTGAH